MILKGVVLFRRNSHPEPRKFHCNGSSAIQRMTHAIRIAAPTLVALTFASVAHAQGTMDFTGATTLMTTFKTFAIYAGAVICFGGLIFAGIRMLSGRFQDAIPGLRIHARAAAVRLRGSGRAPLWRCRRRQGR